MSMLRLVVYILMGLVLFQTGSIIVGVVTNDYWLRLPR